MFLPDFLQVHPRGGVMKSGLCRDPTSHTREFDIESPCLHIRHCYTESMRLPCFFNERTLFFLYNGLSVFKKNNKRILPLHKYAFYVVFPHGTFWCFTSSLQGGREHTVQGCETT